MQENENNIYSIFENFCIQKLKLSNKYPIDYTDDKAKTKTYGHFDPNTNRIVVFRGSRSLGDVFRTVAHELVHLKQHELGLIKEDSGKTGSSIENKANAGAGIIMRWFGQLHPEIYN